MTKAVTIKVEGLRELQHALAQLPKATQKNVLKRVLTARSQPVIAAAASLAPDDPRTGGYDLRNSIAVSTKLSKRQAGLHRKAFKDDRASVEMFIGPGPLPQATFMEFGTFKDTPQPYMRPAWASEARGMLDGIKDDLWSEISKAAKRYAKKLARLAG